MSPPIFVLYFLACVVSCCCVTSTVSSLNREWRGSISSFDQPLDHKDEVEAQKLTETLHRVNCEELDPLLTNIEYRGGEKELDTLRQVFRWDLAPYDEVFKHGLKVKREHFISDETFYNLFDYVHEGEQLLDSREKSMFGFISTTISNSWYPPIHYDPSYPDKYVEIYRYEIYTPGGIWVTMTLGDRYLGIPKRYDEVAFVLGVAPQYIRSAQLFRLKANSDRTTTIERVDNTLIINNEFNPQSHPLIFLELEMPICDYKDEKNATMPLKLKFHHQNKAHDHNTQIINGVLEWYSHDVTNIGTYLDAAFRSSRENEAYYLQKNRGTLVNYDPTGTNDKILDGPYFMRDMFQSLKNTPFGEHGVDCAFGSHDPDEAYVFSSNVCALMNYAPHTKNDKILKGPTTIARMFPFLKGTIFEGGIDTAFETMAKYEAYLFRGNQCARVNYKSNPRIISIRTIPQEFSSINGTVFERRVDAAYASHLKDEAYLFNYNLFAQINFANDTVLYSGIIGSQAKELKSLFPYKNRGLDLGTLG